MITIQSDFSNQKKTVLRFTLLFFLGFFFISCADKTGQKGKNKFTASVDLISPQDITIQLFYKKMADDSYTEQLSIKKTVKGSIALQHLFFELPHDIRPKNIRIDLGENENTSIAIQNISFRYRDYLLDGKNGIYKSWFTFNQNIIEEKDGQTFRLKRINNLFDPQMNGNRILNAKLVKLFPPNVNEL